jgi:hypothetical protein
MTGLERIEGKYGKHKQSQPSFYKVAKAAGPDPPDMQESIKIYHRYLIRNSYERKSTIKGGHSLGCSN